MWRDSSRICVTCSYASTSMEQLDDELQPIIESIKTSYPKACQCARQLAVVVKMRLGSDLTEAEIAYLALHVARVTNGVNRQVD